MPDKEEKIYTETEHQILLAVDGVRVVNEMQLQSFNEHVKDDDAHFQRLYDADEKILDGINKVPQKMAECSEKIKTDILSVSRKEFVGETALETYKGTVKESMAEVKGSLKTTYIVMGVLQSVLLILLAAWLKSNGV